MQDATLWVIAQDQFKGVPIGYFGASTGSTAAMIAAARLGHRVSAVVSRGGRADLTGPVVLSSLMAPTLLIVGGAAHGVIELNEQAFQLLRSEKKWRWGRMQPTFLKSPEPLEDDIVCPAMPEPFYALSLWYKDMQQASDDEVRSLLQQAWHGPQLRGRGRAATQRHDKGPE
jgi:hypothetical protein